MKQKLVHIATLDPERVYVGIGASILENISIVDDVIIGAGAVVNKDINIQGTYVGVPAKIN